VTTGTVNSLAISFFKIPEKLTIAAEVIAAGVLCGVPATLHRSAASRAKDVPEEV
jgi:hypothetical protein